MRKSDGLKFQYNNTLRNAGFKNKLLTEVQKTTPDTLSYNILTGNRSVNKKRGLKNSPRQPT